MILAGDLVNKGPKSAGCARAHVLNPQLGSYCAHEFPAQNLYQQMEGTL